MACEESSEPADSSTRDDRAQRSPFELVDLLRSIERWLSPANSQGQASRDAVQELLDLLVDQYLAGNFPAQPRGWSRRVLTHLMAASRENIPMRSLDDCLDLGDPMGVGESLRSTFPAETWVAWQDAFDQIAGALDRQLSPAELEVLAALKNSPTIAGIARESRMTAPDVRIRMRRIAAKARKLTRSRPPPPS